MSHVIRTPVQLGQLIQGRRKQLGLTQESLAARISLSQKRQSALERAPERLILDQLLRMLAVLDLELVIQPREKPSSTKKQEW